MRPQMAQSGLPRGGKAIIGLILANVVAYIVEMTMVRFEQPLIDHLFLVPLDVFERLHLWQPITYTFLHSPVNAGHLIFNMLMLWMFGSPLEARWGSRRLLIAYGVCGLAGALFTLATAGLAMTPVLSWLLAGFEQKQHVGASGAVVGLTIAWGMTFAKQVMMFPFLGQMTGRTFMLIMIAVEFLVALSLDNTSSTSHFGGMIGGYLLVSGNWRPSRWRSAVERSRLMTERRRIERELRIIDGGKGKRDDDLPN